jgi:hypothetical protein
MRLLEIDNVNYISLSENALGTTNRSTVTGSE